MCQNPIGSDVVYAPPGQPADAEPPLMEALALYEEMGIARDGHEVRRWLNQVHERMQVSGVMTGNHPCDLATGETS